MSVARKKPVVLSTHQFFERFPDETSARSFIEKRLWEDGKPTCPKCQSQECGVWKARE
ncbi:MAG: transposase, partial [Ectothiorhodospiraceae bacterium AqS1]|nr:transposase [Ectothiorhodospiraceae bacterium AqS1]